MKTEFIILIALFFSMAFSAVYCGELDIAIKYLLITNIWCVGFILYNNKDKNK